MSPVRMGPVEAIRTSHAGQVASCSRRESKHTPSSCTLASPTYAPQHNTPLFAHAPMSAEQGVFRGLGDARTPLAATLGCNALNLALDPLLIFALGWGVAGAAQATVLAEVTTW